MNISKKRIIVFVFIFILCAMSNYLPATDYVVSYIDDATDYTSAIQNALDTAGAGDRVILSGNIDESERKWITGPLFINNSGTINDSLEFILEPGVLLEAKSGAFPNTSDCLIKMSEKSNVIISGYNATMKMLINEYTSGEWRNCISIKSCSNIIIEGLSLEKSGGDGIYLGTSSNPGTPNDNIVIEDVICDGNARQGISIISAKNLTINNCTFQNTGLYNPSGLASGGPWAGIDLEPNTANQFLKNIIISNCEFINNTKNAGILANWSLLTSITDRISVTISNCYFAGNKYGVSLEFFPPLDPIAGVDCFVDITGCVIENSVYCGMYLYNICQGAVKVSAEDCTLINPTTFYNGSAIDIYTTTSQENITGDITFLDIYVFKNKSPYALKLGGANNNYKLEDIDGSIYADQPDTSILYCGYYENVSVSIYKLIVNFDTAFSGSSDAIGGTDSDSFLTSSDAIVYPGDYNGDGKTDLFVKGYGTYRALYLANSFGTGFIRIFMSDADNVGGTDSEAFLTSSEAIIYTGDYNGDGKIDLFVKGSNDTKAMYLANTTGTGFTRVFMGSTGTVGGLDDGDWLNNSSAIVYPGDYNGDGKTDLFVKGYGTYRGLFVANSSGTGFTKVFLSDADNVGGTDSEAFLTSSEAIIYTGDYNGDGRTDLFVKGYGTYRALYMANSYGTGFIRVFMGNIGTQGGLTAGSELTDVTALVYPGDYNGDGKTDLFVKGYGTYRSLYLAGGNYSSQ
jgi:hypothetical protein